MRGGARADVPCGERGRGVMPYGSAAISTEVSDAMGIACAFLSHLHRGSGDGCQRGELYSVRLWGEGGAERSGGPL